MKRTFNYTARQEIKRRDITILLRQDRGAWVFDADLQRLAAYKLPRNAEIWVEAHRQNLWMQFSWGTVAATRPPADRRLADFDVPDGILFRVRVVLPQGPEHHKLVAEADGIHFVKAGEADDHRRPLIVPEPDDLDQLLWKLDLESDPPRLLVNKDARPTWKELARSPHFIALVYPEVLRRVLAKALEDYSEDDEDDGWKTDWIKFARNLAGLGAPPHPDDTDAREAWIESAVAAFARRHQLRNMVEIALGEETNG